MFISWVHLLNLAGDLSSYDYESYENVRLKNKSKFECVFYFPIFKFIFYLIPFPEINDKSFNRR